MSNARRPYHPTRPGLPLVGLTVLALAACDDDPTRPGPQADILVSARAASFAETDVNVGTDERIAVEIRNEGRGALEVTAIELTGADTDAFRVVDGAAPLTLEPGGVHEVRLGFEPQTTGGKSARLAVVSNDPDEARVEIRVTGQAARFQYTQVDRMGIPGLNTVFNHATSVAAFDKTAYNRATPAGDVATYRDQFITVLGAVANPDPEATADLLLPDELPVSLGAQETAFGQLTGRALADDAVDVALAVTVGVAALQSDNVDANDRAFRDEFPYVAAPHR